MTTIEERRYHRAMAKLTGERGYLNLSQAHALAAQDCPARCQCESCVSMREERAEERRRKQGRRAAA